MSERPSTRLVVTCSGLMYDMVPSSIPLLVRPETVLPRARPKSMMRSRTSPPGSIVTMMFSGLMSRCTTARECL